MHKVRYKSQKYLTFLRCAAVCGIRSTCITWTHDSATNTCKVFTQVSPVGFLPSAPSSVGVFADLDDGFFLLNTASGTGSTWLEGQAQCAANNGVIAYAGYEQIKLLLQSVQHSMVWMGLTYDSGAGVWRDHLGNVPQNLYWKSGEPDGVNVYSYYSVWGEGLVAIWGTIWDGKATLCAYV